MVTPIVMIFVLHQLFMDALTKMRVIIMLLQQTTMEAVYIRRFIMIAMEIVYMILMKMVFVMNSYGMKIFPTIVFQM